MKKTTVTVYVNKRNSNKFIEVHDDGYYHYSLRQFLYWECNKVKNMVGDPALRRWRKINLSDLLEDYDEVNDVRKVRRLLKTA